MSRIKDLEKLVIEAFERHPANQLNNDLCWISVIEAIYAKKGLTAPSDFLEKFITNELPSSHSIAAAISNVRAAHPEYELTPEQKITKTVQRLDWISKRSAYLESKRKK